MNSLAQKTIANGASPSEEAAAKAMLQKLYAKYNVSQPQQSHKKQTDAQVKTSKFYLDLYDKYMNEGTLHLHITDIDWDEIAKYRLNSIEYAHYVHMTHSFWERYNMTLKGVAPKTVFFMYEPEYRKECYKKFYIVKKGRY